MTDTGSITVHNPQICAELFGLEEKEKKEEEEKEEASSPSRWGKDDCHTMAQVPSHLSPRSPSRVPSRSPGSQSIRIEEWLSRKARRAVVELPDDSELAAIKEVCQQIREEEQILISELEAYIQTQDEQEKSKREMLYKKWSDRVFFPIHSSLSSVMSSEASATMDQSRRNLFDQYLAYCNKKAVFLDTISPAEYNPTSLSQTSDRMKVTTGRLDDPLCLQAVNQTVEQHLEHNPPPPRSLGREDTDCALWLAMQLIHIDSSVRVHSQQKVTGRRDKTLQVPASLHVPHKTPITYPRQALSLDWPETAS